MWINYAQIRLRFALDIGLALLVSKLWTLSIAISPHGQPRQTSLCWSIFQMTYILCSRNCKIIPTPSPWITPITLFCWVLNKRMDEYEKSKWVWSESTTIIRCWPTDNIVRKSDRTPKVTRHLWRGMSMTQILLLKTAAFWIMYIGLVEIYVLFNRSCTTNDLKLFTFCLYKLCAIIFFATSCPNYAQ